MVGLVTGQIEAPADFALIQRPHPEWSVAQANEIMHHRKEDRAAAEALADCPALSASWKNALRLRAEALRA